MKKMNKISSVDNINFIIEEAEDLAAEHEYEEEQLESIDSAETKTICKYCNGTGIRIINGKAVRCLLCSSADKFVTDNKESKGNINERINILIPKKYVNNVFTPELIEMPEHSQNFNGFIECLKDIYSKILLGESLDRSYYIFGYQGLGKQHWVYACIQECIKKNLTVAPYLDTKEILALAKKDGFDNSILDSDLVFIKMSTGLIDIQDVQVVRMVLDRRARNDKPTVVVSRYSKSYINKIDKTIEKCFISNNEINSGNLCEFSRLVYCPAIGNSDK